ncbi:MAG: GTP pyrophosphokinase [Chloroflexota bacterium]
MNQLEQAIRIALDAHAGVVDKSGQPYILHPLTLMLQMETEEERITAVLHDVVEDSDISLDDLARLGFPTQVLEALELLTHDRDTLPYLDYVAAISTNPLARTVKLADLQHNMDIRRLPLELTEADLQRLATYRQAWELLHH